MSTNKQEKQIGAMLKSLREASLRKYHASLRISFKQMLEYIDKIKKPDTQADIQLLLQTYMEMAQTYYTQCELSILKEIQDQYKKKTDSSQAIRTINARHPDLVTVIAPLEGAHRAADSEHKKLIENFPILLQNALDRLRDEWQRVGAIAVASQALSKDDPLNRSLQVVVEMVAYSVGIEAQRIIIVPGTTFALSFFAYLDNFAVLTIPIYSVQAPWEWSIFWHELAGYQVREVEKGAIIETIRTNLRLFHERYKKIKTDKEKKALLQTVTRNNKFGFKYLKDLFTVDELNLSELGGFEHQFEQILVKLPENNKLRIYEKLKELGWSVDWFKELFEDAYSVLAIDTKFLHLFGDILSRHGARDDRHPPFDVRLEVAKALLNPTHPNPEEMKQPETSDEIQKMIIELVAQQILKFVPLVNFAHHKFPEKDDSALDQKQQQIRGDLFNNVKETINKSIDVWLETVHHGDKSASQAGANTEMIIQEAENIIRKFSSKNFPEWSRLWLSKKSTPKYEEMLVGRDYKQLLELSFFEVDLLSADTIKNVQRGINTLFTAIDNTVNFVIPANLLGMVGEINFECSRGTFRTSLINWNKAFINHTRYQIIG